ncbi:hypothetical protein LSG31_09890 [Fodinisporobacter ferrooxydans]|uniref:Protein kinase domain-containing protein n=1 Tax=Fodinisporobacter ferrooxydans TaxID=2901836 RepID=A0ABY4CR46_9BACL|nr:hypothetical protein LSG31_09890 [Alicyclobacillaceae bacterium MYW30-H2]
MDKYQKFYDRNGKSVTLGSEIGRGGEGSVYEILQTPNRVAKLYHRPADTQKRSKLLNMIALQNDSLLRATAWPLDLLTDSNGQAIGMIMPKIAGYKDIHKLYGPKTRLTEFPTANYSFLIHAATNLARAFAAVHESGQVIGDVNHSNIVVSDQALIKLIDCDSFQITVNGTRFPCDVGVSTHQPPELQGLSLRGIRRTQNHDNFGLAVLIFQLLFMGRHPFSGIYLDKGEMPIERAIREFRFVYSQTAKTQHMHQPPNTLPLSSVTGPCALLFEQAFSRKSAQENGRPSAEEWVQVLETLPNKIIKCNKNTGHSYLHSLSECPWCRWEKKSGILLFPGAFSANQGNVQAFSLQAVWAQVQAVPTPGPIRQFPDLSTFHAGLSEEGKKYRMQRRIRIVSIISCPVVAGGAAILFPEWSLIIAILSFLVLTTGSLWKSKLYKTLAKQCQVAQERWEELRNRWEQETGDEAYYQKRKELEHLRSQYQQISVNRKRKWKQFEMGQKKRQLEFEEEINTYCYKLEQRLLAGHQQLKQILLEIETKRRDLLQEAETVCATLVQAKTDLGMRKQ